MRQERQIQHYRQLDSLLESTGLDYIEDFNPFAETTDMRIGLYADGEGYGIVTACPVSYTHLYGNMADEYWDKITTAADSVMDYVLLYDGEPIQAVYHSCSIGVTESAENVWQASVPYLVPVESEGDLVAPAAEAEDVYKRQHPHRSRQRGSLPSCSLRPPNRAPVPRCNRQKWSPWHTPPSAPR